MGSGYKNFGAEVLTSNDVDGYLMRQTAMTFATAAARDSALSGVLDEGMIAYLEDAPNRYTYYDGSAWITVAEDPTTWSLSSVTQGVSVSCTSSNGWYQRSMGAFRAEIDLAFTSAGTAGSFVTISTPLTLSGSGTIKATGTYLDSGNTIYIVTGWSSTTTAFLLQGDQFSGRFGGTPNFAIASGDSLSLQIEGRYA